LRRLRLDPEERGRFERATLPHLDAAYNLARWLTRDEHAAEDVVQEAFCRAARFFASFRGEDGRAWLLAVVRRASYDWLQKRRIWTAAAPFDEEAHSPHDDSLNPERLAFQKADHSTPNGWRSRKRTGTGSARPSRNSRRSTAKSSCCASWRG
jgi:RNA polymerase sigma factor (sigma-70 family)